MAFLWNAVKFKQLGLGNPSGITNSIGQYFLFTSIAGLAGYMIVNDFSIFLESRRKPKKNILLPDSFSPCQILSISKVTSDSWLYKIKASSPDEKSMPLPYHILIKDDSCQVARAYSPVTILNGNTELGLIIKKYPDGVMSAMLNNLEPGSMLSMAGPFPSMPSPYKENSVKELGLIAAGTGITPFYQLIKRILNSPKDKTRISLYYLNKTRDDIILYRELFQLQRQHPQKFSVKFVLDKDKSGDSVDAESIGPAMPDPSSDCALLVCGPDGLVSLIAGPKGTSNDFDQGTFGGILKSLGYTDNQVYKL